MGIALLIVLKEGALQYVWATEPVDTFVLEYQDILDGKVGNVPPDVLEMIMSRMNEGMH